jgi:Flp pilus assembly protein TadG
MERETKRGQSLVEFAMMLPLLVLFLVAIIQFGIIFATYLTLNHAALVGARAGAVAPSTSDQLAVAKDEAIKAASGFIKKPITADAVFKTVGSSPTPNAVSVTLTYNLNLIFGGFFSPNPYPLSATAVMRN